MMLQRHAITLATFGLLVGSSATTARAQDSTTGGVRGAIKEEKSGATVVGATVVASGPAMQGTQAAITDETGQYAISNLPPGVYQVVVYHADRTFSRTNVLIQLGKVAVVNIGIDTEAQAGETIVIEGRAPLIDQQSTKTGSTITDDYTRNVPTGRTFGEVLGAAAGSQSDTYGTSLSGSTSVENTYIVEGINTTDPGFGLLSTDLPNEFIRETEVITGGYNAEYGRSTGGVINIITKAGSNEFHGSVFGYWTPGALVASEKETPRAGSAIDREDNLASSFDVGAEVGGPVIRDRLWFHVGVNPSFVQNDISRVVQTQVDEDQDGEADVDENGFTVLRELDRNTLDESVATYFYSGKLTGAVTPDHQGSIAVMGSPGSEDDYFEVNGAETAIFQKVDHNVLDVSTKWTSKFWGSATQVDAVAGLHRDVEDQTPGEGGDVNQVRYEPSDTALTSFAEQEMTFGGVPGECVDGTPEEPGGDLYPLITNCPVPLYRTGGIAFVEDTEASRLSGLLSVTQRVKAAGHHVIKVGADIEQQGFVDSRYYTGGTWYRQLSSGSWQLRRFYTPDSDAEQPCGIDLDEDGTEDARCRQIGVGDELSGDTATRNLAAFVQDSWSILPNLTLNAGVRWEQQTLYTAEHIQGEISPTTGEPIPEVAFELGEMIAPRVGVVYDWTQEGRSKVYGHFGRFYESIPMDINARAYGGEVLARRTLDADACDAADPVGTCAEDQDPTDAFSGGGETQVAPGMKAQYLDELVVGTEYEVMPDLKVGLSYIRRDLGRVIEDVSTDGSTTYIVANPGEVDEDAVADLRAEAASLMDSDPERAAYLAYQADLFEGVGVFDRPKRTYNAVQLTAERRFTKDFMMTASYTYSNVRGNFPGLFSPETGQLDPNLTTMFDTPELMANRYGNLPADAPHLVKLDGFYQLHLDEIGFFNFGGRFRAQSGQPINTLGSHPLKSLNESYILPRGEAGRTDLVTRFDLQLGYGRALTAGTRLEAFVTVFNLLNQQQETAVDETYTRDDVNPIAGGDDEDLAHLKVLGENLAPEVNPNYKNTSVRQDPLSMRFGLRLTF